MADVAGERQGPKEKSSIIRYEPAEGAAGRPAANNQGGREQMLHVEAGLDEEGGGADSQIPRCCYLSFTLSARAGFQNRVPAAQIFTLSHKLSEKLAPMRPAVPTTEARLD